MKITFEEMPQFLAALVDEMLDIKAMLRKIEMQQHSDTDRWMSIDQLCDYLPGKPVKATIYTKVHFRNIPHKKMGKRLAFLKSEIDAWLKSQDRKTIAEIAYEAENYLPKKNGK